MFKLTDYGRNRIVEALAGGPKIEFDSIKTTDGSESDVSDDERYWNARSKQSAPISNVSWDSDADSVIVTAVVSNRNLAAAYDITGIGLWAKVPDTIRANMFGYEYFEHPDHMPLPTEEINSYTYSIAIKISNAEAVDFTLEDGTYAAAEDVQELTNLVHANEPGSLTVTLNQTVASSALQGINWLQEVPIQGMTEKYWATGSVSAGAYNGIIRFQPAADKLRLWFVTKPGDNVKLDIVYFKTY